MTLLLLLSLAAAPPLDDAKRMPSLQAEMDVLAREIAPLLRKLQGMRYPAGAESERSPLRRELGDRLDALSAKHTEYDSLVESVSLAQASRLMRGDRSGIDKDLSLYAESRTYSLRIKDLVLKTQRALEDDEASYGSARAAFEREQRSCRMRRNAAAAVAAVAVLTAIGVLMLGRRRPLERTAVAVLEPPALREAGVSSFGRLLEGPGLQGGRRRILLELRQPLLPLEERMADFESLMRKAGAARHEGLAELLGVLPSGPSLALAYACSGGSQLPPDRIMAWPEIQGIALSLAHALHAAHGLGTPHGCLTRGSFLVSAGGPVQLLELGLADALRRCSDKPLWTQGLSNLPTLAPEQESGPASPGADVFSLGAVLYELAVNRPAFPGPNFRAQKLEGVYKSATALRPDLPKALDELILSALSPDPGRRFGSALAFAQALQAL